MTELFRQRCSACRADAPQVSDDELAELIKQLPDWSVETRHGVKTLARTYPFKNFREAVAFTVQVAMLAEAQGHHPEITTQWGEVRIVWWTHKIKGLHHNDFICAAKTDRMQI